MTARGADTTKLRTTSAMVRSLYQSALEGAEQEQLEIARRMRGIDEEIAVLRVKLRSAIEASKRNEGYDRKDLELMMKGISLLVRAVSARYKLSQQAEQDLAANLANVIEGVGGLLMPERFDDD